MSLKLHDRVGSSEARKQLSKLLDRVADGENVMLTRRGIPVAMLVPMDQLTGPMSRLKAIAVIRQNAARNRLAGLMVRSLIRQGRR